MKKELPKHLKDLLKKSYEIEDVTPKDYGVNN